VRGSLCRASADAPFRDGWAQSYGTSQHRRPKCRVRMTDRALPNRLTDCPVRCVGGSLFGSHAGYSWGAVVMGCSEGMAMRCLLPSLCAGGDWHVCTGSDLPLASASSDMIRWGRVLLSHTLDAARSY